MTLAHGGNIYYYSRKYGIPVPEILDFSASINPLGASPAALRAFKAAAKELDNYPDPDCTALVDALAEHHGIPTGAILPANGSTELIYLLPRALRPGRVIVFSPGFSDYERAAVLAGCAVKRISIKENKGFVPDLANAAAMLTRSDMVFLCNPNNPTGVLTGRDEVLRLAAAAGKAGALLVVDEAFIDYAPDASVLHEAADMGGIAVLRNFTKFYGMPGLRAGYMAASPMLVRRLRQAQEPWSVNTPAQAAAVASLADAGYAGKSLRLIERERAFLFDALGGIEGLKPYRSSANFMLVRLDGGTDATRLSETLASKGVLVRDCSNFRGLDGRYIRVAVRTRPDNERLAALIKQAVHFTAK